LPSALDVGDDRETVGAVSSGDDLTFVILLPRRHVDIVSHLWIRERSESIIVLLPRCIPKAEADWHAIHHHRSRVVVEHCGDILLGEGIGGVRDEHAGLAHRTIAHHNTLNWAT